MKINPNFPDASENRAEWMKEDPEEIVEWNKPKEDITIWNMEKLA